MTPVGTIPIFGLGASHASAVVGLQKDVPELFASQHVDEEIGGRVETGEEVGDAAKRNILSFLSFILVWYVEHVSLASMAGV